MSENPDTPSTEETPESQNTPLDSDYTLQQLPIAFPLKTACKKSLQRPKDLPAPLPTNWWVARARGSANVVACTGFHPVICEELYKKYGGVPCIPDREVFFHVLSELKIAPGTRQAPAQTDTNRSSYMEKVSSAFTVLSASVNEIDWDDRKDPFAHHPHFPHVRFLVDTFPITSLTGETGKFCWNPKYGGAVFKVQVVINLLGVIVWFSGPHLGTKSDIEIWRDYGPLDQLEELDVGLADGAYSSARGLIAPYKKPKDKQLDLQEADYNKVHGHVRARVEHTFEAVAQFGLIKKTWERKGEQGYYTLQKRLKVLLHFVNYERKRNIKYLPIGPW